MDLAKADRTSPEPVPSASWEGVLPIARDLIPLPCDEWVETDANRFGTWKVVYSRCRDDGLVFVMQMEPSHEVIQALIPSIKREGWRLTWNHLAFDQLKREGRDPRSPAAELRVWAEASDREAVLATHIALREFVATGGHYSVGSNREDLLLERFPFMRVLEEHDRLPPRRDRAKGVTYSFEKDGARLSLTQQSPDSVQVRARMQGEHSTSAELSVAQARAVHEGLTEILAIAAREDVSAVGRMLAHAAPNHRG